MSESLAIIGISCLFPKADDLQSYWRNIKNGVDAITPIPATHWNIADYFNSDPKAPDQTYAQRGGFLSPVEFNPMDFGIAPKDVEATDTTQLLGMVAAKQALIDAGYGEKPFKNERTSVILGVTGALELVIPLGARLGHPIWRRALKEAGVEESVANEVVERISDGYVGWQENSFPGLLGNVAAGRIANRLDLGGTNCVVDAACGSSMAALHMAAMELTTGRSDMVITGGLDTFNDIFMYMCFSKTPALSPSGDAKPFDRTCDGTILGEGLGMLVIKRLADAEKDGDRIYAVIKGIGTSSDGRGNAVYAPRAEGQKKALERAYADAGVTPESIDLVEAHGTGTKVGDATELKSLTEVFRSARPEGTWAALGSVKSQIGHTKASAGVAGMIKAALALNHKVLPPTIKVTQPVDEVAPGRSPFYVNTQKRPWLPRQTHPRRAGVSAFGFGGTNFHCVLEEHGSQMDKPGWDGDVEIVALSSDSREGLRTQLSGLPEGSAWAEVRTRAWQSRQEFKREARCRLLLPVNRGTTLAAVRDAAAMMFDKHPEKNSWALPSGVSYGSGAVRGKLGALFPGQGSQYVGMFRDLACQFPAMIEALTAADRIFASVRSKTTEQRLSDFIYPHPAFSEEARAMQTEALKSTDIAQPALGAAGLGAMNVLAHFGIKPEAAAGHSYGELLALCGAGRFETESLHLLSNVRGRLMATRSGAGDRGAMLAVQASEEAVTRFVGEEDSQLVIANRNSPSQFVLAGPKENIEEAAGKLARRSVRARVLQVSAAFHSNLVADACEPFAAALENVAFSMGHIPVYANSTAKAYPSSAKQARETLARQIVKPVDFMAQIETMYADGITTFVEMGPGHVLSDLVQAILPGREVEAIALDASKGSRSGTFDLAVTLCRVAALGHSVDLSRWETCPPVKKTGPNGKASFSIPLTGANYRTPRPPRPAKTPVTTKPAFKPAPAAVPAPAPFVTRTIVPADPGSAMQVAQQGILSLQKLQEQTAQLHRQFLENQDATRRTLEALLSQRRDLIQCGHQASAPQIEPKPTRGEENPTRSTVLPLPKGEGEGSINTSDAKKIAQTVLSVVAEKTGYPAEMLNLDMGLDSDLGIDSIKRVEIMAAIRTQLPDAPEIKPEHLGTLQTLKQIVDFLTPASNPTRSTVLPLPKGEGRGEGEGSIIISNAPKIAQTVLSVVAEKTGYPAEMLNLDMGLDSDLGIDSIKRVEIMAAIRTQLPDAPEIKPEHLGTLQTLKQIVDFLEPLRPLPPHPGPLPRGEGELIPPGESVELLPGAVQPAASIIRQVVTPVPQSVDNRPAHALTPHAPVWITEDGSELAASIEKILEKKGYSVCRKTASGFLHENNGELPSALLILCPTVNCDDAALKEAFQLIQKASPSLKKANGVLLTVSRMDGNFGFGSTEALLQPLSGGLAGLAKTAHHEWPDVNCKAIDLSPESKTSEISGLIVEEMFRLGPVEVGFSGKERFFLQIDTIPQSNDGGTAFLTENDVVVITGGARGITATTALQLARTHRPKLVLLGRTQLAETEPEWLAGITAEADIKKALLARSNNGNRSPKKIEAGYRDTMAQREIRECLRQIRATGATALYRTADVRNRAEIEQVFSEIRQQLGPIRGLIHGAGVLADRRIEDKTAEQFDLVYGTKVEGLRNLLAASAADNLKLIALFSSYTGRFGRTGQVDYAVANEVLNKTAQAESRRRPQCRVVAFNWGPWNGGMVSDGLRKIFESEGVGLIEPKAGAEFFVREISSAGPVEVLVLGPVPGGTPGEPAGEDSRATIHHNSAFEREISVKSMPCLQSHVINGRAVLPTALMIEWLGHGAVHGNPGMSFHGLENFNVLKGLILEPNASVTVSVLAEEGQMREGLFRVPVQLVSQSGGRKVMHARAEVLLAEVLPGSPDNIARPSAPSAPDRVPEPIYSNGQLFHGPHFQGIERVESCSETAMTALVKNAPASKKWIQNPLRPGWMTDPLVLDSSFQMMILWSWEHRKAASLPCAIKRFRQFVTSFPKNGSRVVIQINSALTPLVSATLSFFDLQGNLLALAEGYECVIDKTLREAFLKNSLV